MEKRRGKKSYVVCVDNGAYPASLELHKIYQVLPDPRAARVGHVRVIDESAEDYLYPSKLFVPIELPAAVRASFRLAS